jgi:hypothetical protein
MSGNLAGFNVVRDNSGAAMITVATQGYVSANPNNAAALTSNTDYSFKWGTDTAPITVNRVMIQNNTAASLNWDLDVAATAGSPVLASGQTLFLDVQTTVWHLLQTGTPNVNGTTSANIVIRGWL